MQFIFCDVNTDIVSQFQQKFKFGSYHAGPVQSLNFDKPVAYISPANGYGYMQGGIDYYLNHHVLIDVEKKVREKIEGYYPDSVPIGTSLMVKYNESNYLICSPTMKFPSNIEGTDNVYRAFYSALGVVAKYPEIEYLVVPGMGTSCGGLSPEEAVQQMWQAYQDYQAGKHGDIYFGDSDRFGIDF
jgi:O-acetyl-ADP-ribose deacetylase (regulator of RNase III)